MSETVGSATGANTFSPRAALLLVLFGVAVFLLLLWMIGAGMASGSANNGGAHGEGRGLNGYAAFSRFLEKQGYDTGTSRIDGSYRQEGLLVLTPPFDADPGQLSSIVRGRYRKGPTLIILPKWNAVQLPETNQGASIRKGWVMLGNPKAPRWANDVKALGPLDIRTEKAAGSQARWLGLGISGKLPDPGAVQTISSGRIVPLVTDGSGQTLAGYLNYGTDHGALTEAAIDGAQDLRESEIYPVVVVAEPDLLDNYGFASRENAMLASALVTTIADGEEMPVTFDLTLNGLGRSANLLTLAFTPPYLAATICLLLAALAVGWRAFIRFGPARKAERAISFGKAALVANAAGLMRRTRRLHLLGRPYVERTRERIAKALALPRDIDSDRTDAAIDRALAYRAADARPFSEVAARLLAARTRHDVVQAAQELHALERKLLT